MVKRRVLKNRPWFIPFEEELLFKRKHVGWVRWTSRTTFVLNKSPFMDAPTFHTYVVPPGIRPLANSFVEVEVGRHFTKLGKQHGKTVFFDREEFYEVENVVSLDLRSFDLPRPYLQDKEGFLNRIRSYWRNAQDDLLDFSLALQMLSCPSSSYGQGGIGTQSFSLADKPKASFKEVKYCLNKLQPFNVKSWFTSYEYHFIQTKKSQATFLQKQRKGAISELSYNFLYYVAGEVNRTTSIQIPTIIKDAQYRNLFVLPSGDRDILEFTLMGLLVNPVIKDTIVPEIEKVVHEVQKEVQPNYDGSHIQFDSFSIAKLANTFCRLNFTNELSEDQFSEAKSIFRRLYREFEDAKQDTLHLRPDGRAFAGPTTQTLYARLNLSALDLEVYRIIRTISEDEGKEWVSKEEIVSHGEFEPAKKLYLLETLESLSRAGAVITRKNGLEYRYLKLLDEGVP